MEYDLYRARKLGYSLYTTRNKYSLNPGHNLRYDKERINNLEQSVKFLFVKAAQELNLMQVDVDFSRLSELNQQLSANEISEEVIRLEKEVNNAVLKKEYLAAERKMLEVYGAKVDLYGKKIKLIDSANENLSEELKARALAAENERQRLLAREKELFKACPPEKEDLVKCLLLEAQKELRQLEDLKQRAAAAKARLEQYQRENNINTPQKQSTLDAKSLQKQQVLSKPSRVADQLRTFEAQKKSRLSMLPNDENP